MNLNREQFLVAVERGKSLLNELNQDYADLKLKPVFSRFGPRRGQCDLTSDLKKIVMIFPEMLAASVGHEDHKKPQKERGDMSYNDTSRKTSLPQQLTDLLFEIKGAEKDGDKEQISNLWKKANQVERRLLDSDLKLYCGDVLIEFRPGVLKYEALRRLQQDSRLPSGINDVGNIRVIAGSLEFLSRGV